MQIDTASVLEGIAVAQGARSAAPSAIFARPLTAADLKALAQPQGAIASPIQRLRHSHHMLARALASNGNRPAEAAALTGYSLSRISILQADPSFQELITYYSDQAAAKYVDVHERMASLSLSAADELQERLEEKPDAFSNKELMDLAKVGLEKQLSPHGAPSVMAPVGISITFHTPAAQGASPPPQIDGESSVLLDITPTALLPA